MAVALGLVRTIKADGELPTVSVFTFTLALVCLLSVVLIVSLPHRAVLASLRWGAIIHKLTSFGKLDGVRHKPLKVLSDLLV